MKAQDYPVTTPYGQVAGYPLNGGFHNGIDYSCPTGTPVIVNGVTIGISNNTGASTGAHLHVGKFVNGVVQDPGVGNGFEFTNAVVFDTGSDPTNGIFVRITGDGALWNYLHLASVLVTKGQVLKGENMEPMVTSTDQARHIYLEYGIEVAGDDPALERAVGQPELDLRRGIAPQVENTINNPQTGYKAQIAALEAQAKPSTVLAPGNYTVK